MWIRSGGLDVLAANEKLYIKMGTGCGKPSRLFVILWTLSSVQFLKGYSVCLFVLSCIVSIR
jgi:hypothetical protein